jgi:hypothetical protein
MKHLKMAGLCLVSLFVVSMAMAGSASAALLWLVCLEGSGLTKYSSNQCNSAEAGGKWQSLSLPSSDTVRLLAFSLRLEDTGTGAQVECPDAGTVGWGLIEPSNKGLIKVAEVREPAVNCKLLKPAIISCRETANIEVIEGVNLPWKTEIFTTEGKSLTQIAASTAGKEPGWKTRCGGATDECVSTGTTKLESVELNNEVTKGVLLVRARFEEAHPAKCSALGGETGHVKGLIAI